MASVFRQQGSPYWYAAFFDGSGKRRHRSTKKRRKPEAVRVAAEMERLARRSNQPQNDEQSGEIYRILEDAGGMALRGQLNESSARDMLNRILEISTGQTIDNPSTEEWLNGWLQDKKGSRAATTHLRYEGVIKTFLGTLPRSKRIAPLTGITVADVRKFRDLLLKGGRSETTVNMALKILRTPLNRARKLGYLTHNPAEAVDLLTAVIEERATFTSTQVASLVAAAEGDWKGLILGGYYTGARIGDLSNLRWDAVDLERGAIDFLQGKTKRRVEVPIHPEFRRWLDKCPATARTKFVYPKLAGKTAAGRNGLSGQFRRIMEKAKVAGETIPRKGSKGRNRSTLTFHSLRHSFNSAMANAGVSQEMRQRLTGHASKAVNDRYTHAEMETLRRAVATVPTLSQTS